MRMKVYMGKKVDKFGNDNPVIIESNLSFAIPYWTKRKQFNKSISWVIIGDILK